MPRRLLFALLALSPYLTHAQRAAPDIPDAAAQGLTRREYDTPGLVVETGYRTAALDVLAFTADGKYALTAGDDKVVRTWDVTAKGLKPSADYPVLRWPVYREFRGNIYSLALSPDEKSILIAGNDQTSSGFGACVVERATNKRLAVTPRPDKAFDAQGSVWAVAFSPSGRLAALGTERGGVWLWDIAADTLKLVARHGKGVARDPLQRFVRLLAFEGETQLVSLHGGGQVLRTDLATGTPKEVAQFADPIGSPVVRSRDGKHVAWVPEKDRDFKAYSVCVAPFPEMAPVREIPLLGFEKPGGVKEVSNRVGLSSDGSRVAVGLRQTDNYVVRDEVKFYRELGGRVVWADIDVESPKFAVGPTQSLYAEGVTFHPTNPDLLAVAGGDNAEIVLWDLKANAPVGLPAVAAGATGLWDCALSPEGRYLAFQTERDPDPSSPNTRGKGPWRVFDLQELDYAPAKAFDAEKANNAPDKAADGWTVVTRLDGKAATEQWYAVPPGGEPIPLEWDRSLDEFPRCYAFVPKGEGRPNPQLLVGHYWGFSLFECDKSRAGKTLPRSRTFRGHEGYVTGIAVSADGSRVVTSSRDMTLCGWSLGIWPYHPRLGAELVVRDVKLFAGKVADGSPAWEVGLAPGDEILACASIDPADRDKMNTYYTTGADWYPKPRGKPGDVERADLPVGGTTYFTWLSGGKPVRQATSLVERPLWRMFPRGDEWVMWRWRDFYYACSSNGDRNIGWQKSYPLASKRAPEFFKAEQFRASFQKPEKLRQTLKNWRDDGTALEKFSLFEPPAVKVEAAGEADAVKPFLVKVTLTPRGPTQNQSPERLLVWVNDYLAWDTSEDGELPKAAEAGGPVAVTLQLPASAFRGGANTIFAQVYSKAGVRGDGEAAAVTSLRPAAEPKLHARIFGVGDYRMSGQRALQANIDAKILSAAWKSPGNRAFGATDVKAFTDKDVTRKTVLGELAALAKVAKPDDVVVLFLGGHGARREEFVQAMKGKGLPVQSLAGMGRFAFLTGDFDKNRVVETTLDFEQVQKALARVNARKIVLLDACHSGEARATAYDPEANPLRVLAEHGVGCAVLAACQPNEQAQEDANNILDIEGEARGLFTIALRRLIVGQGSPKLSLDEFSEALVKQIGRIVNTEAPSVGLDGIDQQRPDVFVPETLRRLSVVDRKKE